MKVRLDGQEQTLRMDELDQLPKEAAEMIRTVFRDYRYLMQ